MCILCGELITKDHWTDQDISGDNRSTIVAGEKQRDRKRNRMYREKLTNVVLKKYGLQLTEWNNSKYILSDKKGKSDIVHDLGTLWTSAEKMLSQPVDPLDPVLLKQIKAETL